VNDIGLSIADQEHKEALWADVNFPIKTNGKAIASLVLPVKRQGRELPYGV
jgi:hypothetical protein